MAAMLFSFYLTLYQSRWKTWWGFQGSKYLKFTVWSEIEAREVENPA
jgi:hypothetical protein